MVAERMTGDILTAEIADFVAIAGCVILIAEVTPFDRIIEAEILDLLIFWDLFLPYP
jgi:hypothetical protein